MADTQLPPDPYLALGVPKDADSAAIKTAYRKLVLKCHPDKVPDPAEKQAAADRFHIIQTSYERLTDEKARARYDAEVRLAELRKERPGQRGSDGAGVRSQHKSSYDQPRQTYEHRPSDRPSPLYEERRPAYAEYFDAQPKASRKDQDYERTSRRSAPVDVKEKVRAVAKESKESERVDRREKAKKTTKDTRRERETKYSRPQVEVSSEDTDSDAYARDRRPRDADRDDRRRDDNRRSKESYYDKPVRPRMERVETEKQDERSRKLFSQHENARDYISRATRDRQTSEIRPLPSRTTSTRDQYDVSPKGEVRPEPVYRRSSSRQQPSSRVPDAPPRMPVRERERYSSNEEPSRQRPPAYHSSRSSPSEIHIPSDKPRAQSLQHDANAVIPPAGIKRAETMPMNGSRGRHEKPSRSTEYYEGLATPAATPEYSGASAPRYDNDRSYQDSRDYPARDSYRDQDHYQTEVREPTREGRRREPRTTVPSFARKITSSPSPQREIRVPPEYVDREARDRYPPSAKYAERPQISTMNSRTTSYRYDEARGLTDVTPRSRPASGREASYRDSPKLFGEVSPVEAVSARTMKGPSGEERYVREFKNLSMRDPYEVKRSSKDRPAVYRQNSAAMAAR